MGTKMKRAAGCSYYGGYPPSRLWRQLSLLESLGMAFPVGAVEELGKGGSRPSLTVWNDQQRILNHKLFARWQRKGLIPP